MICITLNRIRFHKLLIGCMLLLFIALAPKPLCAQTDRNALQHRKSKLEKEIMEMNLELEQTKKTKSANLNQLVIINKKIDKREELINAIEQEVGGIEGQVKSMNDTIYRITMNLNSLKDEYARIIYSTYRNRSAYDRLMFIFSSHNFNQAYKRLKYLQQYTEYRKAQVNSISETQRALAIKKLELEKRKSSKLTLKHTQEQEKNILSNEKKLKDDKIKNLTSQEKKLLNKLRDNEVALNKLQTAIESLVANEIKKANEEKARKASIEAAAERKALAESDNKAKVKAEVENKAKAKKEAEKKSKSKTEGIGKVPEAAKPELIAKVEESKPPVSKSIPVSSNSMSSTAEEVAISGSFAGNKGRLPSPVERGSVISSFGEHPHAEFQNIKVKNNGVDILSNPGARANVIFEGEVSSVMFIANLNYIVIVRHGDYLSVYSNLEDVSVKKGDKVKIRQPIGTIFTAQGESKSRLHFELWQGTIVQNPANWIRL